MRKSHILILLIVALICIGPSASSAEDDAGTSWHVRVIVDSEEAICEGATVSLRLLDAAEEVDTIEFSFQDGRWIDGDWEVDIASEARYTLSATVTSCSGLRTDHGQLELDVTEHETGRDLYVAVRYEQATPRLTYLEAGAEYTGLMVASEDSDGVVISNHSTVPIRRCSNALSDEIAREFLVEGTWGKFNRQELFFWPEDLKVLPPRGSLTVRAQMPRAFVVHLDPEVRKVRPERKRFLLFGELDDRQYRILGRRRDIPAGLPGCNVYYVESEITDRDPTLRVTP